MTVDTEPRIVKLADLDELEQALGRFGRGYLHDLGSRIYLRGVLPTGCSSEYLRRIAAAMRELTDVRVPDGPSTTAAALEALADRTEQREPRDWDLARLTKDDAAVIWPWIDLCGRRSPLLEPLAAALRELRGSSDASVVHARRALEVLADADRLLPGVDAALRPVLVRYAGEQR